MFFRINCLMTCGGPVSPVVAELLFQQARLLYNASHADTSRKFRTAEAEGVIKTERKVGIVGSICGTIFNAEFECLGSGRSIRTSFVIHQRDLHPGENTAEERFWIPLPITPADKRHFVANAMMN